MKINKILISLLTFISLNVFSFEVPVRYVYDGDTIMITISTLPHPLSNMSVRLSGIDTPEIRGKCQSEKDMAKLAKEKLQELIGTDKVITLTHFSHDKFGGRINGKVSVNGKDLATELISSGLAKPYSGGTRSSWCK